MARFVAASEVVHFDNGVSVCCVPNSEEEQDIGSDEWARKALRTARTYWSPAPSKETHG